MKNTFLIFFSIFIGTASTGQKMTWSPTITEPKPRFIAIQYVKQNHIDMSLNINSVPLGQFIYTAALKARIFIADLIHPPIRCFTNYSILHF